MRRLAYLGLSLLCLLSIAWGLLLWLTERTTLNTDAALPSCASQRTDERYLPAIEKAHAHLRAMMVEREIPGLSVAVAVDGQIVWSEGLGYAIREAEVRACPETRFRVGSVSKLFTVAAMAQLYEQGRLDLDAPIQRYVPGFPDKGYVITARELASHRSGIRNYRDDREAINTKPYATVAESLEKFRDDPLVFAPESDFLYSNYGYVLLSAALEGASGEDFLGYMHRHIFEPLRMLHTVENRADSSAPGQSAFYDHETPFSLDGTVVRSPYNDFSAKWAAGGFLSTAEDMVIIGSAHMVPMNRGFLQAKTLDLLFTPRSGLGTIAGYGMGWMTARDLHFRRVHFHFGAASGGTAVLAIYPGQRVSIAIASNLGHAKFPYGHLIGVVNPFLNDPAIPVLMVLYGSFLMAGIFLFLRRRCGERRGSHTENRAV